VHSARFDADGPYGHAAGRTLVIDDLAELDAMRQARLAACLEASRAAEGPRVVAVTALDPAAAGAAGDLRADLFHARHSAPVYVPPLRAPAEDVPELLG
jgi:DNA-binding NtrC family response regulator